MLATAFFERVVQLAHQLALVLAELDRCFHRDVAIQVARIAGAHALDALATQAELLAALRAFRDINRRLAGQRGHFNLATQRRRHHADGHGAVQVIAIALKDVVLLDANLDVQIARWPAIGARLAVARRADAHAAVDTDGDFDFQGLLALDLALAAAGACRVRE